MKICFCTWNYAKIFVFRMDSNAWLNGFILPMGILALGKELPFLSMLKQNKRFAMQYANQQLISNLVIATKMSISVLVLFPMAYVMYHITRTNVIWTQFLWLSFENYWTKTILSENIPSASILINYMNEGLCLMFHQIITITQALSLTTTLSSIVL